MHSALYTGWVRHRRYEPQPHAFSYRVLFLYMDLSECDTAFRGRWFWSARRRALAWFRREDHFGPREIPLDEWVRTYVAAQTGVRPTGPIRVLTQPRVAGYVFNPISVFHCFDAADTRVEVIVAEVGNTPWEQRHCYVLGRPGEPLTGPQRFRKDFHVSPFLSMGYEYLWRSRVAGDRLVIHMENHPVIEPDSNRATAPRVFDATLSLRRVEIGTGSLAWALLRYPLMPLRVVGAIYWQALLIWWKKIPYVPHPGAGAAGNGGAIPAGNLPTA
jgi:uncharacterized protein